MFKAGPSSQASENMVKHGKHKKKQMAVKRGMFGRKSKTVSPKIKSIFSKFRPNSMSDDDGDE